MTLQILNLFEESGDMVFNMLIRLVLVLRNIGIKPYYILEQNF